MRTRPRPPVAAVTAVGARARPRAGGRRPRSGGEPSGPSSPAVRLQGVRALLDGGAGASVYDIAERFGVSVRTALRYLEALRAGGEPLYEDPDNRPKGRGPRPTPRRETPT